MSARDDEFRRILAGRDPRVDPREGDVVRQVTNVCGVTGWVTKFTARRVVKPTRGVLGAQRVAYEVTPRGPHAALRPLPPRAHGAPARAGGEVVCRGEP